MNKLIFLSVVILLTFNQTLEGQVKIKENKGKFALVEKREQLTEFIYDEIKSDYSSDYYIVKRDSLWGALNKSGEVIIPIIYEQLKSHFNFLIAQKNGLKGIIDTLNNPQLNFEYQDIDHFYKDSTSLVKQNGTWFHTNENKDTVDQLIVFHYPDKIALFKNCKNCNYEKALDYSHEYLLDFVFNNLKYPSEAREEGISGMTVISFVVTKKCEIINPQILRDIGGNCGFEGIEVVKKFPKWSKPAIKDGKPVDFRFILPLKFALN